MTNQIKALRAFIKWLASNMKTYQWSKPDDMADLVRLPNETDLMAEDEIAELRKGVPTYTLDELTTLFRYATDHERVHLLMGLNFAFAQSECRTYRLDEMMLEGDRWLVKRIRRKPKVYGEFSVWPETIQVLNWVERERAMYARPENLWVFLTPKGKRPSRQRIYDTWDTLLTRVRKDNPDFRRLRCKFLRKMAA